MNLHVESYWTFLQILRYLSSSSGKEDEIRGVDHFVLTRHYEILTKNFSFLLPFIYFETYDIMRMFNPSNEKHQEKESKKMENTSKEYFNRSSHLSIFEF